MNPDTSDPQALLARVALLQRQVKTYKRFTLVALASVGAFVLLAQANPQQRVVTAGELVIRDGQGRTKARLDSERLSFYDDRGDAKAGIGIMRLSDVGGGFAAVTDLKTKTMIMTLPQEIEMFDADGEPVSLLNFRALGLRRSSGGQYRAVLDATDESASLRIKDADGYMAVLGKEKTKQTQTGSVTSKTAASLTLLAADGHVIWEAP